MTTKTNHALEIRIKLPLNEKLKNAVYRGSRDVQDSTEAGNTE
jgi:hypothetical protein